MEIRDPIHGPIHILDEEIPIIENSFFQRLRNIKQLGFSEYIFPGATHTRFLHSIGVMGVAIKVFSKLFQDKLHQKEFLRLQETFKLAALLHDIGHAPLSHSTESVMPLLKELQLPARFLSQEDLESPSSRQANHEDYTIKSITDSSLTPSFSKVKKAWGVDPCHVAELITGQTMDPAYFTIEGVNYFPLLHQLITSELDCDRMDYLLRDSYFTGVSYGQFDLNWIVDNLRICRVDSLAYLGISERAISTFDDFLLSRFHMFLMVYFHYRAVCLEQLLYRFLTATPQEYKIPADIEEYQKHDDYFLMDVLKSSQNKYARQIVRNSIPDKIFESFGPHDGPVVNQLENYFRQESIEFIRCSSQGRLSKYSYQGQTRETFSIKVVKEYPRKNENGFIDIRMATDLFQKYSEAHIVTRLYSSLEELSQEKRDRIQDIIRGD